MSVAAPATWCRESRLPTGSSARRCWLSADASILPACCALPWWQAPLKLAATLLSSVSGIPGGLFAPSLSVGAGLAAALSWLLPSLDVRALGLLAMVGYFAGVVQAPLTAFVIVLEMTADNGMVVPLMATALLAT